ncbi:hypothetical protein D1115_17840 [Vibrio alfacsensis]|uniref:Uncharacterized protein n=1 Tax=Vibrio alfacsensis TaxID=1074311 RepID=A0ABN5PI29_9VIBR|nr:hypothetical protein [Vibrio alfacsensis]AXY02852.1 hypothetical protein D1115_17840 [Vibrio alfacsensis]
MKINWLSAILIPFSLFLFYSGYLSLHNALTTNAIESRLEYFSTQSHPILRPNDAKLGELNPNVSTSLAHGLNSFVLFNQWLSYLNGDEAYSSESIALLTSSAHIRPTWSNTYVELAKLSSNSALAHEYQQFALKFGPYMPTSQLLMIDQTFTNWPTSDVKHQVEASKNLVTIARIWRHRPALNTMITYSEGKSRMCNLLAFNNLKVQACG